MDLITVALPVITRHPNYNGPIIVAEGNNVVLRCEATGNGTLNYQWRRASGRLPSNARRTNRGQILTINNIGVSDNGEYYCEVDNGGEKVTSSRVQVTAKSKILINKVTIIMYHSQLLVEKPKITNNPSNKLLEVVSGNEQVTLTCEVTGDDIAGGYWERQNGPVGNNVSSLSDDKSTLTINIGKARPEHSGRYRCVAYSQWGVAQSRNVQVTITSESNNVLMQ